MYDHITILAVSIITASLFGVVLTYFRFSLIIAYILTGIFVSSIGFIFPFIDQKVIEILSDFGLVLLLFILGMRLDMKGFLEVWKKGLFLAVSQIFVWIVVFFVTSFFINMNLFIIFTLSFSISISSTAIVITLLQQSNMFNEKTGKISLSMMISQDILVIPLLIILKTIAISVHGSAYSTFSKVFTFYNLLTFVAPFLIIFLIFFSLRYIRPYNAIVPGLFIKKKELKIIVSVAFCMLCSLLGKFFGFDYPYGAFIAGLIINMFSLQEEIFIFIRPIQSLLLMFFFLGIGLKVDINFIITNIFSILFLTIVLIFLKILIIVLLLYLVGERWGVSWKVGFLSSSIGEFSFILLSVGQGSSLVTDWLFQLATVIIVLSFIFSPVFFSFFRKMSLKNN